MAENINDVLGIAESSPTTNEAFTVNTINNSAEDTLTIIANIVLVCGIIATFFCIFTICFVKGIKPGHYYIEETQFNPIGVVTTLIVLFSSLISWSFMKVLANISLTLKEINKKMK